MDREAIWFFNPYAGLRGLRQALAVKVQRLDKLKFECDFDSEELEEPS